MTGSYPLPMRSSAPVGSPSQYADPKRIDALLKSSDPEAVAASGRGYQEFAAAYEKIAGELLSLRSDLHDAWTGKDAAAAQSQLREVWSAAATVHRTAQTFGVTIERHGTEHLAWYKYNKPASKSLPEAQSWMAGANERVTQAWDSLPQDLSTSLPPRQHILDHGPAAETPSRGTYEPREEEAKATDTGSEGAGHRHVEQAIDLAGNGSGSTQLAGAAAPGTLGGGTELGPSGLLAPGVAGGLGGQPPSGGGILGPGLMSSGGVLGADRPAGSAGGVPGSARESQAVSAAESQAAPEVEVRAARPRAGALGPAAGTGAAAAKERERSRLTWLAEEEEVWTEGIEAAPELIRGDHPLTAAPEPRHDREVDLSADVDAINEFLAELNTEADPGSDAGDVSTETSELRAPRTEIEPRGEAVRGLPAVGDGEDSARD
ncbi:hypothetical protein [Actinoallomurus acaciae]|uniref:PPE family protein n=1 Tax=Actinoallomurus acaciae TaxID=502577 RepID=A0ABV5YHU1_9ACTN